jgi:hypothetical protein
MTSNPTVNESGEGQAHHDSNGETWSEEEFLGQDGNRNILSYYRNLRYSSLWKFSKDWSSKSRWFQH